MNASIVHRRLRRARLLWAAALTLGCMADPHAALASDARCTLAFVDVTVVPMDREGVLEHQNVLIHDRHIAAVSPRAATAGCRKIVDGRGKFLVPGLIDAHVHVESVAFAQAFGVKTAPIVFADVLALYPAYGVTSIRILSGAPDILQFKRRLEFKRGPEESNRPVPRLIVASPMMSGSPPILPEPATRVVTTPDAARAVVQEFVRAGYDLIKIRENLSPDVFRAITDEAKRRGIDVDGHITRSDSLQVPDLINAGQRGFAHLDEVARAMTAHGGNRREDIIGSIKARDGYISTTMVVLKSASEQIADYDRVARRPETRFLHPLLTSTFWTRAQNPYLKPGIDGRFFIELLGETKRALKLLTDRGVRIMAGTDALNPMIIPGQSMHEELQLMVEAGLTPYQVLKTATFNPAQVLRGLSNAGIVAPRRDADLLLLASNPLQDIGALTRPEAVVLRGRLLDRAALDRRLEDVAATYRAK